jgi:hypothetical protein
MDKLGELTTKSRTARTFYIRNRANRALAVWSVKDLRAEMRKR